MTEPGKIELSASLEDYLEAILRIIQRKQAVRAKDISQALSVGKSSVTGALKALAERGLINYAPYDVITLTDSGRQTAGEIARRHETLRDFFVNVLALEESVADQAACKLEHAVSEEILERFVDFVNFVAQCPRGGEKWIKGFSHYCENGKDTGNCEKCVSLTLQEIKENRVNQPANASPQTPLDELRPGEKGVIAKLTGTGSLKTRLLEMGATAGTVVEVERVAPLGDPLEIKLKGYHLTLRREEAQRILVRRG